MNENKNCNQLVREWWTCNGRVIKVGIVCGLVGVTMGFIKGANAANRLWLAHDTTHVNFNISRQMMHLD